MTHYMVDLFYPVEGDTEPRKESVPVGASSDAMAIDEAETVRSMKRAAYFHVRKVLRKGEQVIHDSRR